MHYCKSNVFSASASASTSTVKTLIELDVIPRARKYNQRDFLHNTFADLKKRYVSFERRKPGSTCGLDIDNSMTYIRAKFESKFEKHHLFRILHPSYSPGIIPCDIWLIGILKEILKDREFTPSNESEDAISMTGNDLTFDDSHRALCNSTSCFAWVIEKSVEYVHE
jgi:hypothetical protein